VREQVPPQLSHDSLVPDLRVWLLRDRQQTLRGRALERAKRYSWQAVTDEYEQLLRRACDAGGPGPLPPELVDAA